jgi:long-subunit acyl-CoA synthetase (AMP-forming)
MGIERTSEALRKAHIILWLTDDDSTLMSDDMQGYVPSAEQVVYKVVTKIDLWGNCDCAIDKNADGVGVLWLRGHQVFGGYLNNEEANKEVFDERGFFNTGDLVSMDKNGELHFAGRKKQVIVLDSGKNVYPDELEGMFITIPGVKNVAVFEHRVKDKTVTYGVFSVEPDMTIEKLGAEIAAANKKVASYKWVTHFAMTTEDLPLTSTQKVKHHVVRKNLIEGKYPDRHE